MRQSTPTTRNRDYDSFSSPDPLASSGSEHRVGSRATTPVASAAPSSKKLNAPHSPSRNISHGRKISHEYSAVITSPTRMVSEQNLSPWKIRVTVEAEPEDEDSPGALTNRTTMTTRTTKVPLHDSPSPTASRTGREMNKSEAKTSPRKRRSGTPVRGARRRQSITDLDVRPLGDDDSADDWEKSKKKRSPRKGGRKTSSRQSTPAAEDHAEENEADLDDVGVKQIEPDNSVRDQIEEEGSPQLRNIDTNNVSVRPRARSTTTRQQSISSPPSSNALSGIKFTKPGPGRITDRKVSVNSAMSYPTPSPEPEDHPHSPIGGVQDARKAQEPVHDVEDPDGPFDTIMESEGFTMIDLETLPSVKAYIGTPNNTVPSLSHAPRLPHGNTRFPERETTNKNSNLDDASQGAQQASIHYPNLSHLDETELSSNVPSSPPVSDHSRLEEAFGMVSSSSSSLLQPPSSSSRPGLGTRKITPLPQLSSPKLSSPPAPPKPSAPKRVHQHRKSASAVVAGIALQDIMDPASIQAKADQSIKPETGRVEAIDNFENLNPNHAHEEDESGIFRGFDASTKRELRMGLRFGEELAKRAANSIDNVHKSRVEEHSPNLPLPALPVAPNTKEPDTLNKTNNLPNPPRGTQIWRGETLVRHSPIPAVLQNAHDPAILSTPESKLNENDNVARLNTTLRREREWAAERAVVSKQIREANSSQVIVIDSSDDEDNDDTREDVTFSNNADEFRGENLVAEDAQDEYFDGDETDIWLVEAREHSSSFHDRDASRETEARPPSGFPASHPRRQKIPSPWKRGEDIDHSAVSSNVEYTGLDSGSGSGSGSGGLDDSRLKFGAGRMQRGAFGQRIDPTSARTSGAFDVELMTSPIKSEAVVTHNNRTEIDKTTGADDEETMEESSWTDEMELYQSTPLPSRSQRPITVETTNMVPSQSPASNCLSPAESPEPSLPQPSTAEVRLTPPPEPAVQASPPRSAMKGARQMLDRGDEREGTPGVVRRVIWSQRNRGIDEMGYESSFSMGTGSSSIVTEDSVQRQLMREQQQFSHGEEELDEMDIDEVMEDDDDDDDVTPTKGLREMGLQETSPPSPANTFSDQKNYGHQGASKHSPPTKLSDPEPAATGWRKWMFGSGPPAAAAAAAVESEQPVLRKEEQRSTQLDGSEGDWHATKSAIASSSAQRTSPPPPAPPTTKTSKAPAAAAVATASTARQPSQRTSHQPDIPQYLLPPSYPSDPTRDVATPLATSGAFTNAHFRTLHVLHAKSLRPRFHAPKVLRPTVSALRGAVLEVDESRSLGGGEAGEGVFEWMLGDRECEVLERFMREVEWGWGFCGEAGVGREVKWGWSAEELANWYCRIVVGEVVRAEEAKAAAAKGRRK